MGWVVRIVALNESPSEKEGKSLPLGVPSCAGKRALNESPSEKEGKLPDSHPEPLPREPLNESPSEKEGKYRRLQGMRRR